MFAKWTQRDKRKLAGVVKALAAPWALSAQPAEAQIMLIKARNDGQNKPAHSRLSFESH
jgi:hypothetical protein